MPVAGTRSGSSDQRVWVVPDSLRPRLAARYGPVLSGEDAAPRVRGLGLFASCGDRVTADAIRWGNLPLIGVVDGKTQRREPVDMSAFAPLKARAFRRVRNPAGVLTGALRASVADLVASGGGLLEIEGEEDLASLALVESLPAGATVIYGIPGAGVSFVTVDAAAKERVRELIGAMEVREADGA
jgi:uncharacterized protein (UPF0218 family)